MSIRKIKRIVLESTSDGPHKIIPVEEKPNYRYACISYKWERADRNIPNPAVLRVVKARIRDQGISWYWFDRYCYDDDHIIDDPEYKNILESDLREIYSGAAITLVCPALSSNQITVKQDPNGEFVFIKDMPYEYWQYERDSNGIILPKPDAKMSSLGVATCATLPKLMEYYGKSKYAKIERGASNQKYLLTLGLTLVDYNAGTWKSDIWKDYPVKKRVDYRKN